MYSFLVNLMQLLHISRQIPNLFHVLQASFSRLPSFDISLTNFHNIGKYSLSATFQIKGLVFSQSLFCNLEVRIMARIGDVR